MADNIAVTPGSGATIATDEVTRNAASEHQQIVKLSLGAEGAFDMLLDSGQQTSANSLPVVLPSDQIVAMQPTRGGTAAVTAVAASGSSTTLLSAESDRLGASIFNDADQACFVKFGATASSTSFTVKIAVNGYFEFPQPVYTGVVDAIWENSPSGNARITELT
jgi:hypothetical protein